MLPWLNYGLFVGKMTSNYDARLSVYEMILIGGSQTREKKPFFSNFLTFAFALTLLPVFPRSLYQANLWSVQCFISTRKNGFIFA